MRVNMDIEEDVEEIGRATAQTAIIKRVSVILLVLNWVIYNMIAKKFGFGQWTYTMDIKYGLGRRASLMILQDLTPPILKINYDIFVIIANEIGVGSATCLGLTCRQMYRHLKEFHPGPISLDNDIEYRHADSDSILPQRLEGSLRTTITIYFCYPFHKLGINLQNWIGPEYFLSSSFCSRSSFLNRSIYGNGTWPRGSEHQRLTERYSNFDRLSSYIQDMNESVPSPFNLGHEWYNLVLTFIKIDLEHAEDLIETTTFWMTFKIYNFRKDEMDRMFNDARMDIVFEGIRLLGL